MRLPSVLLSSLILCLFIPHAIAANWNEVDTIGTLTTQEGGSLGVNLWNDYTQNSAIKLLEHLPNRLRSPAYKSAVRRLLLTNSKPLKDDVENPAFLAKRINMLVQYGLFIDAQNLYNLAASKIENINQSSDLAVSSIILSLVEGDLAATCLDIRVYKDDFKENTFLQDLNRFCQIRFGEEQNFNSASLSFESLPLLSVLLTGTLNDLPKSAHAIEILIAFSDDRIDPKLYNNLAKKASEHSDLFIALSTQHQHKDKSTFQCYAIESSVRGIISYDDLTALYIGQPFDDKDLKSTNGSVSMHPCDIPSFFYQRKEKSENALSDVDILLQATQSMPIQALVPFQSLLTQSASKNKSHQWVSGIITGLMEKEINDSDVTSPLIAIQKNESLSKREALKWKSTFNDIDKTHTKKIDYALPIYISISNSLDLNNFDNKVANFNYEKFYSLTYVKKSLYSSIGTVNALRQSLDDNNVPQLVIRALSKLGKYPPKTIAPNDLSGIITSFGEVKLTNEKQIIAIEALL